MQSCCYRNKVNVTITSLYQIHLLIHIVDFVIHFKKSWEDDGQVDMMMDSWCTGFAAENYDI